MSMVVSRADLREGLPVDTEESVSVVTACESPARMFDSIQHCDTCRFEACMPASIAVFHRIQHGIGSRVFRTRDGFEFSRLR